MPLKSITVPYSQIPTIVSIDCGNIKNIKSIKISLMDKEGKPHEKADIEDIDMRDIEEMEFDLGVVCALQDLNCWGMLCGAFHDIYIASSEPVYYKKNDGTFRFLFGVKSGEEETILKVDVDGEITCLQTFVVKYKSDQNNPFCINNKSYLETIFQK